MAEHAFDHRKLSNRILLALGLGLAVGIILNLTASGVEWVQNFIVDGVFSVVGDIFVGFLKMLIVPLVFVSLVTGVSSLSDPGRLGRVGGKSVGLYLLTTGIAISLALAAAVLVRPGEGASPPSPVEREIAAQPPFSQVLVDMVPSNPVQSMAEADMLPIIVFAVLLGLSIAFSGRSGERVGQFFSDFNEVVMRLTGFVMLLAPYGVFALIAGLAASTGLDTFFGLAKYVVLVLVVLVLHAVVTYSLMLKLLTGLSPRIFFSKMRGVLAFAFSTASSGATIPVTLKTVEQRLGADNRVASFTVPLGATINMDGTAIMQGIAAGFIAQYYGVDLGVGQYLMIVLMVIMASVGAAGVPGVGLVLLAGVLTAVGLPAEGIGLILGVDRVLDMTRTAVNVTGDAMVTTVVAHSEGELDREIFEDQQVG
ncbi:dicarboxylate/amino acid:cation symporter [Wenzhouxiangella marina]|uniref:Putative proton/glutamate symporter n=1 Tax=Wenzhouxiangella marina TaxID=1579979 RepID=A0A0K0XSE4_9GAMM|nr:dicarboxylate/amino acid:cation symporter [Wenzhouxiangella marina]AKS40580.1 Putative proton/glutamate symporter [Wenzhouxiangella marina]MBB6088348.1 Na+/H+-dicarboxylate symporter [Wenzhouxiangella marina]